MAPLESVEEITRAWDRAIEYAMERTTIELTGVELKPIDTWLDEVFAYVHEQMELVPGGERIC